MSAGPAPVGDGQGDEEAPWEGGEEEGEEEEEEEDGALGRRGGGGRAAWAMRPFQQPEISRVPLEELVLQVRSGLAKSLAGGFEVLLGLGAARLSLPPPHPIHPPFLP
jgi:hypothetical protein